MRKMTLFLGLMLLFFTKGLWAATPSPVPMLESSASHIIATLEENKSTLKNNPTLIRNVVRQYLLPHVDVAGMSRSVLGPVAWKKASVSERQQFSTAFTDLVIRTYSSPLAEYTDETVKFLPLRGEPTAKYLHVNSIILRSNGQKIPLNYSLVLKNGRWKIYDLSVEGVSLLQSFRSQFAEALRHSDMQEVIKQLRQRSDKKVG